MGQNSTRNLDFLSSKDPREQHEDDTDENAGRDREVEPKIVALHANVARQSAEPQLLNESELPANADNNQKDSNNNESFCHRIEIRHWAKVYMVNGFTVKVSARLYGKKFNQCR